MVSVRKTHLTDTPAQLEQWLMQLALSPRMIELLKACFNDCLALPKQSPGQQQACLNRARDLIDILLPLNMDIDTLRTSILCVYIDAGFLTLDQVREQHGPEIATLVQSVEVMDAIRTLGRNHRSHNRIESVRQMLLAMVEDVRGVVIKLAQGVVSLREAKHADEESRVVLARVVQDIYAPLANRLGIGQLKWELEDLAFRYLHPETYKQIAKWLDGKRLDRESYIEHFVADLQAKLDQDGIQATVYGRPKHIYSIWRKMQKKNLDFAGLYDVRAVRIIANRLQDCYGALGLVHSLWHHLPNEFDDYIATPKPNSYQSIHTVVMGPQGKTIEIQIRTEQMHQDAELGVAAHWIYKAGSESVSSSSYEDKMDWLRKIIAWQEDVVESVDLVEEVRSQVFEDRVYVFSPKGEVVDLPAGSTVLDYAYYIHSQVGHKCIGAKVDTRIVPFTTRLETGQRIEILTSKEPNPKRDWLNANLGYIQTSRARAKIQSWFKKQDKEKNQIAGKEMLENELAKVGLALSDAQSVLARFNLKSIDDLMAAIGAGDVRLNQVINHLQSKLQRHQFDEQAAVEKLVSKPATRKNGQGTQIEVDGVGNLMTHIAKCCQPLPGDAICGYITQGRGISVHRQNCEQLTQLSERQPDRVVEVKWSHDYSGGYHVTIQVIANDRAGLLRDVTTLLANERRNVLEINSQSESRTQTAIIDIKLELNNMTILKRLLARLEQIKGVLQVHRQ